jgi:signal transduction histidine kinase
MDARSLEGAAFREGTRSLRRPPRTASCRRDNGSGLPAAARDRLFDAFYTTKDNGLGLGLSICETIVEAHGGELTVRDDQDGGAVAIVTLPELQQSPDQLRLSG